MSLRNTDSIDIIVQNPHGEGYDLIVFDAGDIDDEIERYTLLVEKLSAYANYVCGGQLAEEQPDAEPSKVRFVVISDEPPNQAMLQIQAMKPRELPDMRFPVVFTTKEGYLQK